MTIKEISILAHDNAKNRGFYDIEPELAIMEKLDEEATELQEAIANNDYRPFPNIPADDEEFVKVFEEHIKDSVGGEFADNIIVLCSAAEELKIPLDLYIEQGLRYNKLRKYR